jgi:hypothetical protein
MISRMTMGRPQKRYDHRLRELVQRTEELTIATELGVPRSTARGWLCTTPTVTRLPRLCVAKGSQSAR